MSAAWDYIGKKHVELGATRWVCEWYVWHEDSDPDDEDRDPIDDGVCMCRNFPTRGLAEAYGRTVEYDLWGPTVHEEEFVLDHDGKQGRFGSWETRTEREDVDVVQVRSVPFSEIANHPNLSLSPRDYLQKADDDRARDGMLDSRAKPND